MAAGRWRDTSPGRVLSNLAWLLAGKGVGALLSLVYLGLAARTLGAEGFGQFTLVLGTAQATAACVRFQTWQIAVRYGMSHLREGRSAALARLIGFCTGLDLAAALVGCAVATVGVLLLGPRLGWSAELSHAAILFCLVVLLSFRSTAVGVLRLHDRFGVGAMADATTPVTRFAGSLVVVAVGGSVRGFLLAWAVAEVTTALVYWRCAGRVAPGALALPRLGAIRLASLENPGIWRFSWLSNANSTLNSGSKHLVVVLVGLATGAVGAGHYRIAAQLSQVLARVSEMFSRAVFPEMARAHAGRTGGEFGRLLLHSTLLAGAVGLVTVLVLLLLGRPMLELVAGHDYAGTYPLLLLLSIAAAVDLAGVSFEPALIARGRVGQALRVRAVVALCLLLALALLLPALGTLGAAVAVLAASATALVLFGLASWRVARSR